MTLTVTLKGGRDEVAFQVQRRRSGIWRYSENLDVQRLKPGRRTVQVRIEAERPKPIRVVAIGKASSVIAPLKIR